ETHLEYTNLTSGGRDLRLAAPFDDGPLAALMPDGSGVVVVERRAAHAPGDATFTVRLIGPDGDTRFARTVPYRALALPEAVVAREVERLHSGLPEPRPSAGEVRGALEAADFLPRTLAPVSRLAPTQDGRIWIGREE